MDPENKALVDELTQRERVLVNLCLSAYQAIDKSVQNLNSINAQKIELGVDPDGLVDYPEMFEYPKHLQDLARWLLEADKKLPGAPIQ